MSLLASTLKITALTLTSIASTLTIVNPIPTSIASTLTVAASGALNIELFHKKDYNKGKIKLSLFTERRY